MLTAKCEDLFLPIRIFFGRPEKSHSSIREGSQLG